MRKKRIGDLCTVTSSKRIFQDEYVPYGVPFWRSKEVIQQENGQDISDILFISEERYRELERFGYPTEGDLLLTSVGTIGSVYRVKNGDRFYFKDGNLTWLKDFDASCVDSSYLMYLIRSSYGQGLLQSRLIGSSQKALTISAISEIEIILPEVTEQKRIVATLSAYDDLIENNRKQIKLLEEAAQRLYKEWFIDLRFSGHEEVSLDSETGLPEGWSYCSFIDVVGYVRGRSYSANDLVDTADRELVNLNNIAPFGGWQIGAEKPYSGAYKAEQIVQGGNLVMAVTDMTKERRLVGHVGSVPRNSSGSIISMDLIRLVPKELETSFLYGQLRYSGIASMISMLANGTNVLHLKPESLNRVQLLCPSREVQESYAKEIEPTLSSIDCQNERIALLTEARNRLLPKLMSGELEV